MREIRFNKIRLGNQKEQGFSTLISVIIVGAIALAIAVTLLTSTIDLSRKSQANQSLYLAKNYANGCAERALYSLRSNLNYAGNETINMTYGSCTILPITGAGSNTNRIISTKAVVGDFARKVKVTVSVVNPNMTIASWEEIPD